MLFSDVCDGEMQESDVRSRDAVAVRKNPVKRHAIKLAPVRRKRSKQFISKYCYCARPIAGSKVISYSYILDLMYI